LRIGTACSRSLPRKTDSPLTVTSRRPAASRPSPPYTLLDALSKSGRSFRVVAATGAPDLSGPSVARFSHTYAQRRKRPVTSRLPSAACRRGSRRALGPPRGSSAETKPSSDASRRRSCFGRDRRDAVLSAARVELEPIRKLDGWQPSHPLPRSARCARRLTG